MFLLRCRSLSAVKLPRCQTRSKMLSTRFMLKQRKLSFHGQRQHRPSLWDGWKSFSRARNVVKEFVLWPLLSAISALISPTTKVRASSLYPEPVNIYTLFLAESGSNKSTAFSLSIDPIVQYVEEKQNTVIVVEDSSRNGMYEHLKTHNGQGLIAKDEAHAFFSEIVIL